MKRLEDNYPLSISVSFNDVKTNLVPLQFGVFGGFDLGRVWCNEESSNQWHNDFGGGFWLNILNSVSTQFGVFSSKESVQFSFGLGMSL